MPARHHLTLAFAVLIATAGTAAAQERGQAKEQVEFGVQVAQRGLWREAIYRWERATQLDPTYAAAFNNLAVAYEQEGQLDKARAAYEKAFALEPNNPLIKQNFDLFKDLAEVGAAYLFYLCRNLPFIDGNKRTALGACILFLRLNGIQTKPDGPEWESLMVDVASGTVGRDEATTRLRTLVVR
jgi:death-on-curing family protein